MNQFFKRHKVPALFCIVCLALLSLMTLQVYWLNTSSQLIKEQFDQKVNLAMGSALADFNRAHQTSYELDDLEDCDDSALFRFLPSDNGELKSNEQTELLEYLSAYMTNYGISEKYKATIFDNSCQISTGTYCCPISTQKGCYQKYSLGVSFNSRKDYLFDEMIHLILSSILVFLLLSAVSFIILRALVRQKRITDNNIDFFNNTAHELKTPLTNIGLASSFLSKRDQHLKDDRYLNIINEENAKLKNQIDRVLSLSQMENGTYKLNLDEININQVLENAVQQMHIRMQEKGGSLILDLPTESPIVMGDEHHIGNVFRNLIDNAIKYADKKPRVNISMNVLSDKVVIRFSDNGIGISKLDQEHIFEKFQRVGTGNLHEAKGFGIGLSYARMVMKLHKGLIRVQSELQKGSHFELTFPI